MTVHVTKGEARHMVVGFERLLYSIPDAAFVLQISRAKVYAEINRGAIKPVHIGSAARIPADEIQRYVQSLKAGTGV